MEIKFKVIVPVFNAEKYIDRALMSVCNQTYKNFDCVVIDDASLDQTSRKISEGVLSLPAQARDRFKLIRRSHNCGALENICYGIDNSDCKDEDVIVLLDGDDMLFNTTVLSYLNKVYQDPKILLTYGSYINSDNKAIGICNGPLPCSIKDYRKSGRWVSSHLRTFRYKIWKRIDHKDLVDDKGNYYRTSWDLAILLPLIEMAGEDRIKYIKNILYVYNLENPINDHKKDLRLQLQQANEIRAKKQYNLLKEV